MIQILLVEDDAGIARHLSEVLRLEGWGVARAGTQAEAVDMAAQGGYDLALLDIALPDGSGYEVCTAIRERSDCPVIFLTASGEEMSVVTGLNMGADDYIVKPFRPRELVARIRAALRARGRTAVFEVGGLRVDVSAGIVKKGKDEVFLSALEYRLLLVFINNPNAILTRDRLLDELWDAAGEFVNDNTLTVYIKRLREKIEDDPAAPRIILTVRGMGYRLGDRYVQK